MKKLDAFKLTALVASVAAVGMGCASSGYARHDANDAQMGMAANVGDAGVSANAEVGTDSMSDGTMRTDGAVSNDRYNRDHSMASNHDSASEGSSRVTVSALSSVPETRVNWVNKFPFYDNRGPMGAIETYTFAVPDPNLHASTSGDLPQFSVNLPPGSVFVESAGGAGEVRTGRVIQHSPVPTR